MKRIAIILLLMGPYVAFAGSIERNYKWTVDGQVHYSKTKPEGVSDYTVEFRESNSSMIAREKKSSDARFRSKPAFLTKVLEAADDETPGYWWWGVEGDQKCRKDYFRTREGAMEVMLRTRENDNVSSEYVYSKEVTRIHNGLRQRDIILSASKKACFLIINGFKEY